MTDTSSLPAERTEAADDTSSHGLRGLIGPLWRVLEPGLRRQAPALSAGFAIATGATVCALAGPVVLQTIIDEIVPHRDLDEFLVYSGYLVVTYLGFFALWAAQIWITVIASERIFLDLRERVVATILNKSTAFFRTYHTGDIVTRLINDLDVVATFFYENIIQAAVSLIFAGMIVAFILYWHWGLGLVCLACLPLYILLVTRVQRPIIRRAAVARDRLSDQNDILLDLLAGHREIRFFQQRRSAARRFADAARIFTAENIRAQHAGQLSLTGIESVGILVRVVPFLVGGLMIVQGSSVLTTGVLVAYFTYLTHLTTTIANTFEGLTKLAQVQPALRRIQQLVDFPNEPEGSATALEILPADATVAFTDVGFAYREDRPVFDGLDLVIPPGEKIAIMAPSGSGKSTLVDLLLRFQAPTEGVVSLGGVDARKIGLPVYLSYFSYVGQTTHLFNLTVAQNIAMGWYDVPLDRLKAAAAMVRMDAIIEDLPQRYDTLMGEAGMSFSGGQLQRLALARALVRDPQILVLDEFTSALDRQVEAEILDDLLTDLVDQTVICITHAEHVARRFDRIVHLPQIALRSR